MLIGTGTGIVAKEIVVGVEFGCETLRSFDGLLIDVLNEQFRERLNERE